MTDPGEVLHYRLAGSRPVAVAGPGGGVVHTVVHLVTELHVVVGEDHCRQPRSDGRNVSV